MEKKEEKVITKSDEIGCACSDGKCYCAGCGKSCMCADHYCVYCGYRIR